jgi:hypothetical protein
VAIFLAAKNDASLTPWDNLIADIGMNYPTFEAASNLKFSIKVLLPENIDIFYR